MKTRLTRGRDNYRGSDGDDWIVCLAGDDQIDGREGDDRIFGGLGGDDLIGNQGRDILIGGDGDDSLVGGGRGDRLIGGAGNDSLVGGDGRDLVYGGAGADTILDRADGRSERIVYRDVSDSTPEAFDQIWEFAFGEDRIGLHHIDADATTPENDLFRFIDGAAFSGAPGELRVQQFMLGGLRTGQDLLGDVDGDGVADIMIRIYISQTSTDHIEVTDLKL